MENYKFYKDVKMTVWNRNYFSIEANNKEEALEILNTSINENLDTIQDEFEEEEYTPYSEYVLESSEYLPVEENNDCPTVEIYDNETGEILFQNGK